MKYHTFALVTVCTFCVTMGTFTCDISVGQKLVSLFIIILFRCLFDEFSFVIQRFEKLGSQFVMCL